MSKKSTYVYYDVRKLMHKYPEAYYYMVIGERSNGKTYSALDMCLENWFTKGQQFAYIRRFGEDIRKKQMDSLFSGHYANGRIESLSSGEWDNISYNTGKFRLIRYLGDKTESSEFPIGYAFDLNGMEHYKSISFPGVTTVIFDEFLSRSAYLPNEFLLFTNTLSTIIRNRTDVKILMLGNTVNKYSPYFEEMGLKHVKEQKQGTVDVYKYAGNDKLTVIVDYTSTSKSQGGKASDVYFAFDNPQLQMITTGTWEIAIYPHLPVHYKPKEIVGQFFVDFDHELLHGEIIAPTKGYPFIFVHRKTTPIQDEENDIVYGQVPSHFRTHRVGFTRYDDRYSKFIRKSLNESRIFYSTNEVGEIFRNYVIWSLNQDIRKM